MVAEESSLRTAPTLGRPAVIRSCSCRACSTTCCYTLRPTRRLVCENKMKKSMCVSQKKKNTSQAKDLTELARAMRAEGYDAVVAPIKWFHWIPCLGGRSVRPILERIDWTVDFARSRTAPWTDDCELARKTNKTGASFTLRGCEMRACIQ